MNSGYVPCGCRDCMEIAIGKSGALCWECREADCEPNAECSVDRCSNCGAWENHASDCDDCEHNPNQ